MLGPQVLRKIGLMMAEKQIFYKYMWRPLQPTQVLLNYQLHMRPHSLASFSLEPNGQLLAPTRRVG